MHPSIQQNKPFEDPRRPIEKVRRSSLWLILRHYGIQCKPDASVKIMRALAEEAGIDVLRVDFAKIKAERRAELQALWPETPAAPVPKPGNEFFALRQACKDLNIPFARTDKKEDLLAKLAEARGKDTA